MSNVFDLKTGEKLTVKPKKPDKRVVALIESLYQRRNQITDFIFMAYDASNEPLIGASTENDGTARAMVTYLDDHVRGEED